MPYAYVPKLRELGAKIGLNPTLMNVVDVFTPLFETAAAPEQTPQNLAREVASLMTMAAVKLMGQDPTPLPHPQPVHREALVVEAGWPHDRRPGHRRPRIRGLSGGTGGKTSAVWP